MPNGLAGLLQGLGPAGLAGFNLGGLGQPQGLAGQLAFAQQMQQQNALRNLARFTQEQQALAGGMRGGGGNKKRSRPQGNPRPRSTVPGSPNFDRERFTALMR